ncbi:hypothetical protein DPMN_175078 [Dreissena polymorpha]|uniref:Uncharacterized protein n=1 Tax=Dreissena polymorpha TaxID=45954 RepID=A0A9D4E766_DREPO|nr:hypothetical protein DPMN_175078 [Dreissena polymorpha]
MAWKPQTDDQETSKVEFVENIDSTKPIDKELLDVYKTIEHSNMSVNKRASPTETHKALEMETWTINTK